MLVVQWYLTLRDPMGLAQIGFLLSKRNSPNKDWAAIPLQRIFLTRDNSKSPALASILTKVAQICKESACVYGETQVHP